MLEPGPLLPITESEVKSNPFSAIVSLVETGAVSKVKFRERKVV